MTNTKRKVVGTLLSVALLGAFVGMAITFSAFTSTTSNDNNQFASGDVVLTDNDSGSAAFNLAGMVPGTTESKCLDVTYGGSLDASVTLYGTHTTSGGDIALPAGEATDLAPYLDVEITRGSFPGAAPASMACTGFVAGPELFNDTLDLYPANYATGILDSQASWETGDSAVYQIKVELNDDAQAQGRDANAQFVWEARDA